MAGVPTVYGWVPLLLLTTHHKINFLWLKVNEVRLQPDKLSVMPFEPFRGGFWWLIVAEPRKTRYRAF